jgi:hypothetical protein
MIHSAKMEHVYLMYLVGCLRSYKLGCWYLGCCVLDVESSIVCVYVQHQAFPRLTTKLVSSFIACTSLLITFRVLWLVPD